MALEEEEDACVRVEKKRLWKSWREDEEERLLQGAGPQLGFEGRRGAR